MKKKSEGGEHRAMCCYLSIHAHIHIHTFRYECIQCVSEYTKTGNWLPAGRLGG